MNRRKYRTLRSESLLPLGRILFDARKDLPPRSAVRQKDANETLALKLIERMKMEHRKTLPPPRWEAGLNRHGMIEPIPEMAGNHAG